VLAAGQIALHRAGDDEGQDIETTIPPITAIASGFSTCEPDPRDKASGNIPAMAAMAVITIGRSLRLPASIIAFSGLRRVLAIVERSMSNKIETAILTRLRQDLDSRERAKSAGWE
jgi:hypothetical protein